MGLRWPRSERYGAQGPPWLYPQKVQSRAVTLLGERSTGQKRTQRAASLILGQPPRNIGYYALLAFNANALEIDLPAERTAPVLPIYATAWATPVSSLTPVLLRRRSGT